MKIKARTAMQRMMVSVFTNMPKINWLKRYNITVQNRCQD